MSLPEQRKMKQLFTGNINKFLFESKKKSDQCRWLQLEAFIEGSDCLDPSDMHKDLSEKTQTCCSCPYDYASTLRTQFDYALLMLIFIIMLSEMLFGENAF